MKMRDFAFLFLIITLTVSSKASCPYDNPDLQPWDDAKTWNDRVPREGDQVTIHSGMKVLLNVSPPPLASIIIHDGGVLVWGNISDLKLTVSYILVHGNFEIGSDDCRFQHDAFILLTGKTNSTMPPLVPVFGSKFLGVGENGTLEFHGKNKLSWTKLIQTIPAATKTCGVIYNHRNQPYSEELAEGLHAIAFKPDGSFFDFQAFRMNSARLDPADFEDFINGIPLDSVVAVALNKGLGTTAFPEHDMERIYASIEKLGGLYSGSSQMRKIGEKDAYAFITQKGNSGLTKEDRATQKAAEGYAKTKRLSITLLKPNLTFNVKSLVKDTKAMRNDVDFRVLTAQVANPVIKLKDDVTTWKVGDQIVVTSTDFEWRQAEVFTIIPCSRCASNEIRLDHEFEHMHYGAITYGIDERAEVAMLSRNIKIEGQLEDECYANDEKEEELCELFKTDTFGGHFMVLRYFKSVHVQQVEFYHMGQQRFLGRYPMHFHMCDNADGAWLRDNTVHDSLARCVTIHGTDGVEVKGNVCYKHLGHGFFLEDSAEVRNILDGNIGIGTMHGAHILSDRKKKWCGENQSYCDGLATYWLTHPHNYVRNNVAAGSDLHGFWYIVADRPLGPSKERQEERGIVKPRSAFYTKILQFENNIAHSCKKNGLKFSGRISTGEVIDGVYVPENGFVDDCSSNDPKNPPNENGTAEFNYIAGFTAYKNRYENFWTRSKQLIATNLSLADSPRGFSVGQGSFWGYTEVKDSLFIGETDNVGEPVAPYERSLPRDDPEEPLFAVTFYKGPVFVTRCHFDRYFHRNWNNKFRPGGAISTKGRNRYPTTANSDAKDVTFGFCD